MSKIIPPTVGRKVWYRPSGFDRAGDHGMKIVPQGSGSEAQPLDATVIAVWSDRMVNLLVTDSAGRQFPRLSVALMQPGDSLPVDAHGKVIVGYAEWMPYQVGQAKAAA